MRSGWWLSATGAFFAVAMLALCVVCAVMGRWELVVINALNGSVGVMAVTTGNWGRPW